MAGDQTRIRGSAMLDAPDPDTARAIRESGLFDANWYADRYRDAGLLAMDPCLHFLRYGRLLKRSPGPDFDTRFYLDTYTDAGAGNPLVQFLLAGDRDRRQTTPEALVAHMQDLHRQSEADWLAADAGRHRTPVISYCIPVMGRLSDLEGTLQRNLQDNEPHRDSIEFLIIEFGQGSEVRDWVQQNFADALADGYLRIVNDTTTLDSWHFGKAKNAFRSHLHGQVYSSLDADNFVTCEETQMLLDLVDDNLAGFVFHHFSGQWGDGTSGRISLPAAVYRQVGYDSRLLPRQFDEIDMILGALTEFPALPFIGIDAQRNVFSRSASARDYFTNEALPNRKRFVGTAVQRVMPLNPRGEDYTATHQHWREMGNFNAALSACHRGHSRVLEPDRTKRLDTCKHRLIESFPADEMLEMLFRKEPLSALSPITRSSICVVACVHDEDYFLPRFIAHHRALGVTHFLLVDDNSARPVRDLDLGPDVLVVRPKVGDFRTCKTLWLEGLIKALVPEGTWVCTLDADEMLEMPEPFAGLADLTGHLEAQGKDFATCLLLDMLPDLTAPELPQVDPEADYREVFGWFCEVPFEVDDSYASHKSIAWGFGPHAALSFRRDARYHAFGTFDSLRKLSIFRYVPTRHLNQGFHSFHYIDTPAPPGVEIWENAPIVPIFHYKLIRLFSDAMRAGMLNKSAGYHARTAQNINSIFAQGAPGGVARLAPYLRPAAQARQCGFLARG